jgi:hypothetical protein
MIPPAVRVVALAPVTYLPRRGRTPRRGYVPFDAMVRPVAVDEGEARLLMVHQGQGRSHRRPIHEVGGRRFTPVMGRYRADDTAPEGAEAVLGMLTRSGALERGETAETALRGTPLMPRQVAADRGFADAVVADLDGIRLVEDGREAARDALLRYFEEDVRIAGDRFLVAMPGPLLHLDKDRRTLKASLNPALVDLSGFAVPVFHPFRDGLDRVRAMQGAGIAKGPRDAIAPAIDHLDAGAFPPHDLKLLPRSPGDEAIAARATAMVAPLYAMTSTRHLLGGLPDAEADALLPLYRAVSDSHPWTRLGHGGSLDHGEVLQTALRLLDAALDRHAAHLRWHVRAFAEEARAHALPHLVPATPKADAEFLGSLAR